MRAAMIRPGTTGLLVALLLSLLVGTLTPFVASAQSSGDVRKPANQTAVARYEALRALLAVQKQKGGRVQCDALTNFQLEITAEDYNDASKSPLADTVEGRDFAVPATLFGNTQRLTCAKALSMYYEGAYEGSSLAEKRQNFIKDYYTASSTTNTTTAAKIAPLKGKVQDYMLSIINGRKDSFLQWRDRIISQGFNTCWKWGNPALERTEENRYDKDNWVEEQGGNRAIGYMAEVWVEGEYVDGITDCGKLKTFVLDDASHRYLLGYSTGDLQDDLDGQTEQYKIEKAREILASDNYDSVKACVAGASVDAGFAALSPAQQASAIAEGIVKESEELSYGTRGGSKLNSLSTAFIKDCIVNKSPVGAEMKETLSVTAPSSERTDGGGEGGGGDDDPSCEASIDNPLSWIICPVFEIMQGVVNSFYTAAEKVLDFTIPTGDAETAFANAWGIMRNIANVLFIVALLLLILSQSLTGKW